MQSLINLIGIWFAIVVAIVRRIFARLLLGPTRPTWSWRTDIMVAIARAAVGFAAKVPDDPWINRFGLRIKAPIPIELRNRVAVVGTELGRLTTDEYVRLGASTDRATILYFHGGAYVYGNPGTHRQHVARLVDTAGVRALAPTYRLAPQYRFPSGLDDAEIAYRSLIASGVDPRTVILSGDSAGGGLATALLIRLRDEGVPMPGGAVLFSPYVDVEHTGYTPALNAASDYLPLSEFTRPNPYYTLPEAVRDPLASPIHADLTELPPMLILAGEAEMILDDSVRLAANARRDGVDVTLSVYDDMMHVWPAIVPWESASERALVEVADWIGNTVGR